MTKTSEPSAGFNPLFSWGCGEHVHEPLIQSMLFTTDAELDFVNDLATPYECSKDGLRWTFKIRNDVSFADGEPLTAKDVAFTILGIRDNEAAEANLSMVADAVYEKKSIDRHLDSALAVPTVEKSYPECRAAAWDGKEGFAPKGGAPWVWLANVDHLYFKRDGLNVAAQKPHPHGHGWSLVNNVDKWSWS